MTYKSFKLSTNKGIMLMELLELELFNHFIACKKMTDV